MMIKIFKLSKNDFNVALSSLGLSHGVKTIEKL